MPREPGHRVALGAAMAADRYCIPSRPTAARTRASHLPDHRPRVPIAGSSRRPRREATLAVHELVRLHREERASITSWQVVDGAKVSLGQALATVQVSGNGTGRSLTLRSPFEGVLHRHFLEPGAPLDPADLLAAFRDVTAYLSRSERSMPDDQGLAARIQSPTSPTAIAGRPVLFVNRLPRAVWWSARFCVFTDPGPQVVSVANMRHNQWFGFAAQQVDVPVGQLADLDYTDPGHEATAVLRMGAHEMSLSGSHSHPLDRARRNEPHPDLCSRSDPISRAGVISRHVACFSPALTFPIKSRSFRTIRP